MFITMRVLMSELIYENEKARVFLVEECECVFDQGKVVNECKHCKAAPMLADLDKGIDN